MVSLITHQNDSSSAGSSRLFQPHRSLGLLTAGSSHHSSHSLFQSQRGKFYLQPNSRSSLDAFVTLPIGERFQILNCSKLVPVLVSRAVPPSASHYYRYRYSTNEATNNNNNNKSHFNNDTTQSVMEEEHIYQVISDSRLNVTVVTHGPNFLRRAVSLTLYQRTKPETSLDALPFLNKLTLSNKRYRANEQNWGIVDVIRLGKQPGKIMQENNERVENALIMAVLCAREDAVEDADSRTTTDKGEEVEVVGQDSDESDEDKDPSTVSLESDDTDDDDDDDSGSGSGQNDTDEDSDLFPVNKIPAADCYGRVLIVQVTRDAMKIINTIDLTGIASNFIPHVGIHPATYVNKILLGGHPARSAIRQDHSPTATSLLLINIRTGKMIHSFKCLGRKQHTTDNDTPPIITTMEQSPAVDTIAVGTSEGEVHLINTLHDVILFSLHHTVKHSKRTIKGFYAISSLSFRTDGNATRQGIAPLAVGSDDGSISVWDLTAVEDENGGVTKRTLLTIMDEVHYGGVSKIQFFPGEPLLLSTGLTSNSILMHVFDSPDHSGRVLRQRKGHTSPPHLLRYLHPGAAGGGILANASDGTDASSCQILSCGGKGDLSLRIFSTVRSNLDKEYSQGPGIERRAKKFGMTSLEGKNELLLPEIIGLVTSEARSRDWGDIVTIHKNHAMAYVWSSKRGAQSGPVLRQTQWNISEMKKRPPPSANATSLAISACGNFALVGTMGGVIYKYNIQSGLPRGSFPTNVAEQAKEEERRRQRGLNLAGGVVRTMRILEKTLLKGGIMAADVDQAERDHAKYLEVEAKRKATVERASHLDAVVGIAIDSLNKTVVSAGSDSKIVLWSFTTHMPHKKSPIMLPSPATKLCHIRDSDLAAIAMNNFGIVVFDCSSISIVRHFSGGQTNITANKGIGHTGPISDMGFGPDGRRLFTSSFDGTIRVWDLPTSLCVDWMAFSSPPTSLTLSPTGEFLATSHVGKLGISLWCDKSYFRMVVLNGTPTKPFKMNEPCPIAECEQEGASEALSDSNLYVSTHDTEEALSQGDVDMTDSSPPTTKKEGLITLSGLPPAHWKNLFHLELVKERNKPIEAPEKPPQAPFFLQWRAGLESTTGGPDQAETVIPEGSILSNKETSETWDAVWSDNDEDDNVDDDGVQEKKSPPTPQKSLDLISGRKRKKITHERSRIVELLQNCSPQKNYSDVTQYLSKLGPSSIDIEISSLCYGSHDLQEGLPLLHLASMWLLEACESHESFEAVNAYLHRYLHTHGNVIASIQDSLQEEDSAQSKLSRKLGENAVEKVKVQEFLQTISQLRCAQQAASDRLQSKMQHSICLLRHLSRMI